MSITLIVALCTVCGALVGGGVLVARAVRSWAGEVSALRQEIAALRLEMERARGDDRLEVRDLIRSEVREHASACPAREPTGVRRVEV